MRRSAVRDAAVAQPRPLFGDHRVSIGMNRYLATRCLDELVNLTRLDIYRLLVRARPAGLDTAASARVSIYLSRRQLFFCAG